MPMDEHIYIVAYDIADQKRWRAVFKLMQGYGEWDMASGCSFLYSSAV